MTVEKPKQNPAIWHVHRSCKGSVNGSSLVQCQDALGLELGKKLLFCPFKSVKFCIFKCKRLACNFGNLDRVTSSTELAFQ